MVNVGMVNVKVKVKVEVNVRARGKLLSGSSLVFGLEMWLRFASKDCGFGVRTVFLYGVSVTKMSVPLD